MAGCHLCDDVSTQREKNVYHKVTANCHIHQGHVTKPAWPSVSPLRILAESSLRISMEDRELSGQVLGAQCPFPVLFCELQRHTGLRFCSWTFQCSSLFLSCFPIWQKPDSFFISNPKACSLWNTSHLLYAEVIAQWMLCGGSYYFIVLWHLARLGKNHS